MPKAPFAAFPLAVAATVVGIVGGPLAARANPRAEAVLAQLPFGAGERQRILAGELITTASRETTSTRELALTMAFLIGDPPPDLVAQFRGASGYASDASVTAHGELRGAGSLGDLEALRLSPRGDEEARRFASAKPGSDLNLSSAEIAAFAALPDKGRAAIEAELRKLLLARYQAYRARGLAGIAPYARGGGRESNPAEELARAARASSVLAREAPEVASALVDYPKSQPAQATESFFWVNFEIDGRPTLALTHRLVSAQADGTYVFVDRHYYVSRSHDAVQVVAGIFPVAEGALVLYSNRTFTDQLGGFASGTKQALGRRIMGGQLAALYEKIRARSRK